MPTLPNAHRPPGNPRFRALAAFVSLAFGCATVRVPASAIDPVVPVRDGAAEPQVELWLESGKDVTPQEAERATAEARAALAGALSTRRIGEGEQLLVVRAQGVSRTASRRSDQQAAVAGMVVGAVVIVAAVVVAIVSGKGGGGGGGKVGKGGGGARIGKAGGVRPAPAPARPVVVPGRGVRPAPVVARAPRTHVGVGVGVHVDAHVPYPVPGDPRATAGYLGHQVVEPGGSPAPAGTGSPGIALPPPRPLDVDHRSFFAKDLLRLELTLVERASGAPLWVKTVEAEVDPRDANAVQALLDAALDDPKGWAPAVAPGA